MELRLGEAGRDALGFAVQVPHYLAQAVYPPAALALLGSVTTSTGLDLPDAELREAADRTNEAIQRQVEESAEGAELVPAPEQQYDTATHSQLTGAPPGPGAARGRARAPPRTPCPARAPGGGPPRCRGPRAPRARCRARSGG